MAKPDLNVRILNFMRQEFIYSAGNLVYELGLEIGEVLDVLHQLVENDEIEILQPWFKGKGPTFYYRRKDLK